MTPSFAVEVADVDVESAATNFQHLKLQNEDLDVANSVDDNPAVIIPDHLQHANTDCAHLSFGSFESGAFYGLLPSKHPKYGVEEVPIPDVRRHRRTRVINLKFEIARRTRAVNWNFKIVGV